MNYNHLQLLDQLRNHARAVGGQVAYRDVETGGQLTWQALFSHAAGLAHRLRADLPEQSIVRIFCLNSCEFAIAFLGVLAAGCAAFPVSTDSPKMELQTLADRANVAAIIGMDASPHVNDHGNRLLIPLNQLRTFSADELPGIHSSLEESRLLLLSSGSTGTPKIVCRSGASLDAVCRQMVRSIDIRQTDKVLATVPLYHSYGIEHGLLAPVWAGATVHLCRGLNLPLISDELSAGAITILPGVPSMFEMLAQLGDAGAPLKFLRAAYSAGSPLPSPVADLFFAKHGVKVAQLYGATELGSITYSNPHDAHFNSAGVGRPMDGVAVRISEADGQIWISAKSMFSGYLHESSSPLTDGYFPTGDLGELDQHGNLIITGRIKLLIDVGGLKVNPLEVEEVMLQHPQVGDCIVLPVRQSQTILRLKAIVTPKIPGQPPGALSLRQFARTRLTSYKVPRLFEVRDSLPRSSTGKLLRHLVQA